MSLADVVLAFDTSDGYCAAALMRDGDIAAARYEEMTKGQAERLMPMLYEVLREADVAWADIDRIGVGTGPGNFTGIRLSVAAARGLALSLGRPAIGVTRFDALAFEQPIPCAVALDARRGRIFLQVFGGDGAPDIAPRLLDLNLLPDEIFGHDLACVGSAGEALAERIGGKVAPAAVSPAPAIAHIAASREPGKRPVPFYLRDADAAPPRDAAPAILP
ncbi:MAG: tRNA (adenosine(37)-N6)-threonylcarbamoyltransferase complex dimerization subunit type 1 TsaB [Pseudomonadota bacterium]